MRLSANHPGTAPAVAFPLLGSREFATDAGVPGNPMSLKPAKLPLQRFHVSLTPWVRLTICWVLFICSFMANSSLAAAEITDNSTAAITQANAVPFFNVAAITVEGRVLLPTNILTALFSKYAGTNVSLISILQAASDLELAYQSNGYPAMNIVIAPKHITNGVVTMDVFPGAMPQIIFAGHRYPISDEASLAMHRPLKSRLLEKTAPATNRYTILGYQVAGNTLLPEQTIGMILTNIPGAFGTNVSYEQILKVVTELHNAYYERGFSTVYVGLPVQHSTNHVLQVQVVEGRLSAILVKGNHYFSSNNVMRAVPGLATNMMLNSHTFQAEVNRANANQDRQISGVLEPGPEPGTTALTLQVKDRLPLHGKVELNNESSPGTPALRVNSSAVYDNLWQLDQAFGLQYGFSPEQFKQADRWKFYDLPSVANYSAYYRIPLGSPRAIDDEIAAKPGGFGYDEATHKFNLPPASGQADMTLFASRSTIDNGLISSATALDTNNTLSLDTYHQDTTINNDAGFRVSVPLATTASGLHMAVSGGLDFKTYEALSVGTNAYNIFQEIVDSLGGTTQTNVNHSTDSSTLPRTYNEVYYVPLALRYDASWHDFWGFATAGLGLSANIWDSASSQQTAFGTYIYTNQTTQVVTTNSTSVATLHGANGLKAIAGSTQSTGHWVAITPSFTHTFELVTNWVTTFRADGQWSSEPLISNEQFGAGGVNSVRGYQEGEVFGDTGWHITLEQQTPPHTVGMINGRTPVIIRGTIFMDYAQIYLLDPQGRPDVDLWGTGAGFVTTFGPWWQARFLFSVPLLSTSVTTAYHPYFNFALTAQF